MNASLESLGRALNSVLSPLDHTWIGRSVLGVGNTGRDILTLSARGGSGSGGWIGQLFKLLPGPIRKPLLGGFEAIHNIPGMGKISSFVKFGFVVEGVMGLFNALKEGSESFSSREGSWVDKLASSFWTGLKSITKAVGIIAISAAAATSIPAILGVGALGTTGIIASFGGSLLAGWGAKTLLDKFFPTHKNAAEDKENALIDSQLQMAQSMDNPQKVVAYLDWEWKNRNNNPFLKKQSNNPFL